MINWGIHHNLHTHIHYICQGPLPRSEKAAGFTNYFIDSHKADRLMFIYEEVIWL